MSYTSSHNPLFAKKNKRETEKIGSPKAENINENALPTIWGRASSEMKLVDNQIGPFSPYPPPT